MLLRLGTVDPRFHGGPTALHSSYRGAERGKRFGRYAKLLGRTSTPHSQDTQPLRKVAAICSPNRCSITGLHDTSHVPHAVDQHSVTAAREHDAAPIDVGHRAMFRALRQPPIAQRAHRVQGGDYALLHRLPKPKSSWASLR